MAESRGQAWQAANMANVAVSLIKSSLMHHIEDEQDKQMAAVMLRTLEFHVSKLRTYLEQTQDLTYEQSVYLEYANRLSEEIDWIKVTDTAKVIPGDGGHYVEALVWVSDADVEDATSEEEV